MEPEDLHGDELKINLKEVIIPAELKDLFLETFKSQIESNPLLISREEIDKFLDENKSK
jgi:hypothetical protein